MTAARDRDAIVRAWLDAGPRDLPDATRYAIAMTVRTLPQRRERRLAPMTLAGLAVAAAAVAVAFVVTAGPRPSPIGAGTATLDTTAGPLSLTYNVPEGLELSVDDQFASPAGATARAIIGFTQGGIGAYGWGPLGESPGPSAFTPGARGVVIADVTDTKLHGMEGEALGNDPPTFMLTLNDSEWWDVGDITGLMVDNGSALQGRLHQRVEWFSHLDTVDAEGTFIELVHPSQLIVTKVGDTLVLIQIWAGTHAELDAWIPTAMTFVDDIEFTTEP